MDDSPHPTNKNFNLCMLKNLEEKYSYEQLDKLDRNNADNIEFITNLFSACSLKSDYDGGYTRAGSGTGYGSGTGSGHIVLIIGIIIGSLLLATIVAFLVLKKK